VTRPAVVLPGDGGDGPDWWRRVARLRRIPAILAVVIAVLFIRSLGQSPAVELETSCTTPAFALSAYDVEAHHEVNWAVTGPAGQRFVLAVGVQLVKPLSGDKVASIPEPGVGAREVRTTGLQRVGDDCTLRGYFGLALPPGTYAVRLFTITGDGAAATATPVAVRQLAVTA
jgi:hypothetical protein